MALDMFLCEPGDRLILYTSDREDFSVQLQDDYAVVAKNVSLPYD